MLKTVITGRLTYDLDGYYEVPTPLYFKTHDDAQYWLDMVAPTGEHVMENYDPQIHIDAKGLGDELEAFGRYLQKDRRLANNAERRLKKLEGTRRWKDNLSPERRKEYLEYQKAYNKKRRQNKREGNTT